MAIREILQLGDPVLRETAAPVAVPGDPSIRALAQDLSDTLAHWRRETGYGRGIAAPQIGVLQRVIFLRLPGEAAWPMVNPEIVWQSDEKVVVWDACLSFLSIFMKVERAARIRVRWQDFAGAWHETEAGAERDLAELLQHEIDHLDGILAVDRMTDVKTLCTREEFEKRHRAGSPYEAAPLPRYLKLKNWKIMSKQKDAELVLKLYELRRDEELRKARYWYSSKFDPKSGQDLVGILLSGAKGSAHYRMVTSYWDMAAALVLNGGIDEAMFLATSGELILVYAKIQPFLEEARLLLSRPEYLLSLETMAHKFPNAEEAFAARRRLAAAWLKAAENEG